MSSFARNLHGALLLPLFVTATLSAGCSGEPGQVVVGIVTDLAWQDPLSSVQIQVYTAPRAGAPPDAGPIEQGDDFIRLSSTLGLPGTYVLRSESDISTRIQVTAHDRAGRILVTRAAVFSIAAGQTRFLRLALVKACTTTAVECTDSQQTCVEGQCVSPLVGSDDLVELTPEKATTLDCAGPSNLLVTTTGARMPVRGTGTCTAEQECSEGSCRRASR